MNTSTNLLNEALIASTIVIQSCKKTKQLSEVLCFGTQSLGKTLVHQKKQYILPLNVPLKQQVGVL